MGDKLKFNKGLYFKYASLKYLFWIFFSTFAIVVIMFLNGVCTFVSVVVVFGISLVIGLLIFINRIRTYAKSSVTVDQNSISYTNIKGDGYEAVVALGRRKHIVYYNISMIKKIKKCFGGYKVHGSGICSDCKFSNLTEKKKDKEIESLFVPAYYDNLEKEIQCFMALHSGCLKMDNQ